MINITTHVVAGPALRELTVTVKWTYNTRQIANADVKPRWARLQELRGAEAPWVIQESFLEEAAPGYGPERLCVGQFQRTELLLLICAGVYTRVVSGLQNCWKDWETTSRLTFQKWFPKPRCRTRPPSKLLSLPQWGSCLQKWETGLPWWQSG